MDAQKTRAAVEAMAGHFAALNEAKEDCKANVDGVLELLVAESADPLSCSWPSPPTRLPATISAI